MSRDALQELLALRQLPSRRVVGLMSGTSADGIDAALVAISGCGLSTSIKQLAFTTTPLPLSLRHQIWGLPDGASPELCQLNFDLGEVFAKAVIDVAEAASLGLEQLHLVGSHGQTARHQPPARGQRGSTLQIGEGAVIAERTGLPVICDFRVADVAAGGQGAPLVPLVDRLLFSCSELRVMLNLGGIANITVLDSDPERVVAFDTGPGNMAIDAVARAASGGDRSFDDRGALAAAGSVDEELLEELLMMPYLRQAPPKSTGRELFGRAFVYPLLDRYQGRLCDLAATLVQFTVEGIALALEQFVEPHHGKVVEVIASGGGVHNPFLMQRLAQRLAPVPLETVASHGMDPDAKEAIAFAVLANETLFGRPGNVVAATGAAGPRVLGKLVLPPL